MRDQSNTGTTAQGDHPDLVVVCYNNVGEDTVGVELLV